MGQSTVGESFLINPRWIDIPEETIYQQLDKLGIRIWKGRIIHIDDRPRHYLFGGNYAYPYSLPLPTINRLSKRLNNSMTWYKHYNDEAIAYFNQHGVALNQAAEYWEEVGNNELPKPKILPIDGLTEGDEYIAIIGLFHLSGAENSNNHHLYIDLVDMNSERIYDHYPPLSLYYGWEGMSTEEEKATSPVRIDKLPIEPGANIGMTWNQIIYGFHINNVAVDRFRGIHTRYENDGTGNDRGHHSHYIVLQKRTYRSDNLPDPDPPDPETPDIIARGMITLEIEKEFLDSLPIDDKGKVKLIVPIYR